MADHLDSKPGMLRVRVPFSLRPLGGIGRRAWFRPTFLNGSASSSLVEGTATKCCGYVKSVLEWIP